MKGFAFLTTSVLLAFLAGSTAQAQHCAPITESYLNEISVKRVGDSIALRTSYTKNGGQPKKSYQAYVIAYLEKHRNQVPSSKPSTLVDLEYACVIHTQRIDRDETGNYLLETRFNEQQVAKKWIQHFQLGDEDRTIAGGWGSYKDRIRLAIFVPFLEDLKYSNIAGLPEDRHECNYARDKALLFQELPYRLSLHFGIVQAVRLEDGKVLIEINGDKPKP